MNKKYAPLFEPLQLTPKHTLKNRLVKTAQWFIYPEPDGSVGDRLVNFYENLAKGGVGFITIEESLADYPLGASNMPHLRLDDDQFIPGLTRLAEAIHKHDVVTTVQITHAGPAHNPMQENGGQPVAPSSIDPPSEPTQAVARELTLDEVEDLIEKFAQAALRVKKAGFDGAEYHSAHYAIGNAFLSKRQNKRTDEFGGSIENRARFGVRVLKRMRELCGEDFILGVRMNGREWGDPDGETVEDQIEVAKMFEAAGANYLQVSSYGYGPYWMAAFPDYINVLAPPDVKHFTDQIEDGALIPDAALIRKAINIPVSGVGRLNFDSASKAVGEGQVDMAAFGRRFMTDPYFPTKLAEGKEDDVRPCCGCLHCLHTLFLNIPVQCRVNPTLGREAEMDFTKAEKAKDVMVIGAGPAGLEAARVAALKGHKVTVYDQAGSIGGLLPMATFIKSSENDDIPALLEWFEGQLKKLGVSFKFNTEMTGDKIKKANPDAVIFATGGKAIEFPIKHNKVVTTEELKHKAKGFLRFLGADTMAGLTKIFLPTGKKVVVVGSDLAGLEAVEFLVKRGKEVTLIDEAEQMGSGVGIPFIVKYPIWLQAVGVEVLNGVKYGDVTKDGINITTAEGEERFLECDTVMVVNKFEANTALFDQVKDEIESYLIGDANGEGGLKYIHGSIQEGHRAALKL